MDNIYCAGCKGDTTWVVHKLFNPALNMYAWTVTCLGCRFRSLEFAYERAVQSGAFLAAGPTGLSRAPQMTNCLL